MGLPCFSVMSLDYEFAHCCFVAITWLETILQGQSAFRIILFTGMCSVYPDLSTLARCCLDSELGQIQ